MKIIKLLLVNEFRNQIHTFKFALFFIISLIVTITCLYVQIKDFEERQKSYNDEVSKTVDLKKGFRVYSEFKIPILIKPNPLSILAKGYDEKIGNKIVVSPTEITEFQTTSEKKNPFLEIFNDFDVLSIIQIIFSLMILFLVSDSISGDRENQTLKMVFVNYVSRFDYFISKFLGNLVIVLIPFFTIVIIYIVMMMFNPLISFGNLDWLRFILICFNCVIYLSIFIVISLLISSISKTSSTSVLYSLFVWLFFVVIYPNTINYTINYVKPIPSTDNLEKEILQVEQTAIDKIWANYGKWGGPSNWSLCDFGSGKLGAPELVGVTQKYVFESLEKVIPANIETLTEAYKEIEWIKNEHKEKLVYQKELSNYFLKILPNFLLEESVTRIANTDLEYRDIGMLKSAKLYKIRILEYLKKKDAFGLLFFTQMKREEMKNDYNEYSKEIFQKYSKENYPQLNLNDIPVYNKKEDFNLNLSGVYLCMYFTLSFFITFLIFKKSSILN